MEKTIKEIADELGISKQALRKHIDKLPTTCVSIGSNRTIFINTNGQEILKTIVSTKVTTQVPTSDNSKIVELTHKIHLLELEKDLKNESSSEQIKMLNNQILEKDNQIAEFQKLLDQEQQLRMVSEQKLLSLEEKNETTKERGFFSRIFKSE